MKESAPQMWYLPDWYHLYIVYSTGRVEVLDLKGRDGKWTKSAFTRTSMIAAISGFTPDHEFVGFIR